MIYVDWHYFFLTLNDLCGILLPSYNNENSQEAFGIILLPWSNKKISQDPFFVDFYFPAPIKKFPRSFFVNSQEAFWYIIASQIQ